ncbi:hypothetical protein BHE74_00042328 [Ensete ventricosum]|nr:hypothetical protein GW17_00041881 [Ensete ventricosum]RWW51335.1 hypothetical protein BHE74_00042328 [Ensete ventricosum]
MLLCDNEKREWICHEPEPLLVLMGRAAAATGKTVVQQGSARAVEEEDGDRSGSNVSKAFMVTKCWGVEYPDVVRGGGRRPELGQRPDRHYWHHVCQSRRGRDSGGGGAVDTAGQLEAVAMVEKG